MYQKQKLDSLPRYELVKKITIPNSDSDCIIVPPNQEGIGFAFECFGNGLPNKNLDKFRFQQTVFEANKIAGLVYREKRLKENSDPMQLEKKVIFSKILMRQLIFSSFFVIFTYAIMLGIISFNVLEENDRRNLFYIVQLLIITILSFTFLVSCYAYNKKALIFNFEKTLTKKLKDYLKEENEKYYFKQKCTWIIGHKCFWLELHGNIIKN